MKSIGRGYKKEIPNQSTQQCCQQYWKNIKQHRQNGHHQQ